VILDDPRGPSRGARANADATLDELLRRIAEHRPDQIALVDPPNRASFTDGEPRRLTYAQADRVVSALAGRLRRMGLYTDAIVGIQMANTVEAVLTILGVLRAGLIAMPLPLLWRRAECVAALNRVSANTLIVSGQVGAVDQYDLAMQVAAEIFPIRYVCGFGPHPPDGFVPFDDLFDAEHIDPVPALDDERAAEPGPGAHLAVVTWDVSADGLMPVGRSHSDVIAGGDAVLREALLAPDATLLSTLTLSSFAGLATAMVPWLLAGGRLALHHPFDPATFLAQCRATPYDAAIVPGPLAIPLARSGYLGGRDGPRTVIGVWRAPERVARASTWREPDVRMVDVHVFGEVGLIPAARADDGTPAAIELGARLTTNDPRGMIIAEIARMPNGTIALRGPMVPRSAFPPGAERSGQPCLKVSATGFVDTGFPCLADRSEMIVSGPPAGLVSVGGYRFVLDELDDLVTGPEHGDGVLAVLPDPLVGQRLAGAAVNRDLARQSLARRGVNPLLVGAFRA
jgi:hypothetical protein